MESKFWKRVSIPNPKDMVGQCWTKLTTQKVFIDFWCSFLGWCHMRILGFQDHVQVTLSSHFYLASQRAFLCLTVWCLVTSREVVYKPYMSPNMVRDTAFPANLFIRILVSIHPVWLCQKNLFTKYIQFHLFTRTTQTTKGIYSIIQDNLVHKRLDCVNIVLSFLYQIQNQCLSYITNRSFICIPLCNKRDLLH